MMEGKIAKNKKEVVKRKKEKEKDLILAS